MRKQSTAPPSDEFQRAFIFSGSVQVECDFCGRTHFAKREDAGWEAGELEQMLEKERENPGQVMGWDCTSIGRGTIDGQEFAECCPCREIRRYEDWVWEHRHEILNYVLTRSKRNIERAKAEAEELAVAQALMDREVVLSQLEGAIREAKALDGEPGDSCIERPDERYAIDGDTRMCGREGHGWRYDKDTEQWVHYYGLERAI